MRPLALAAFSFVIACILIFLIRDLLGWYGYGRIVTSQFGTMLLASLILAPIIIFLLTPLNNKVLARRKFRQAPTDKE